MKKLIHFEDKRSCLCCDNPQCNYEAPPGKYTWGRHLIGTPCPQCGESLLTPRDYRDSARMIWTINWINRWFGWLGTEYPKDGYDVSIRHHDGQVIVRQERAE
jgi:hypothetical protein